MMFGSKPDKYKPILIHVEYFIFIGGNYLKYRLSRLRELSYVNSLKSGDCFVEDDFYDKCAFSVRNKISFFKSDSDSIPYRTKIVCDVIELNSI